MSFLVALLVFDGRAHVAREHERALYMARHYATNLMSAVNNATSMLYMLDALIVQGDGHVEAFDSVARDIMHFYPFVRNVALAPEGIVRSIYPLAGERAALGHNLLNSPDRKTEALLAERTGALTLSGPFALLQGGMGVVGRLPIFSGPKRSRFWGLVCITLDFPALLDWTQISQLEEQGYAYTLWRNLPENGDKQILSCARLVADGEPLDYPIDLPNSVWTLSIVPAEGWLSLEWVALRGFTGLLICLLLAFLAGTICDLINKKRQLEFLSGTDPLTRLPNRLRLSQSFTEALLHAKVHERLLAVCFLDMNGFKRINDTFGHRAGDCLLVDFSQRLKPQLHKRDFLARIGGDEFVLLLEGETVESIRARLDDLLGVVCTPFTIAEKPQRISLSMGVSLYPQDGRDMDTLLRRADEAMYRAKGVHAQSYCFFKDFHLGNRGVALNPTGGK